EYAATGYYTGSSGDTNHAAFNAFTSKFTMFSTEVSGYLGTDFPVLIVDDTTRANTTKEINSYIRLLTNTREDYGTDVAGKYEVKIYNMVYENGVFTPSAVGASLKREYGQFYMLNSTFDSGKSQFSLVDVRFFDPVKTTDTAYHLYIPVFVKKVLSYQFDIAQLSGTTYLDSIYTPRIGQALIENIGMPVTLNFRYTYSRTPAEWAEAINAGENVDRNYAKSLLFYKANTNDCLKNFPANTVLVLVDPDNGGKPYYATFGEAMTGNTLNLSAFKSVMTPDGAGGYTFSGDSFTPQTLSNMMTLSAATTGTESDTMVQCAANEATVTVNGQGYRLATDEDTGTKYTISVSDMETEEYYLSIYTESNAVNDELFHYYLVTSPTSFSETEYPSKITDTGAHTLVHTVMGKIFYHSSLTVNSQSSQAPSLIMTDSNNALTVNLSAQFGLSDDLDADIKTNLQSLIAATDVYQSYLVILNRRENGAISKVILGEPTVTGSYETDYTLNATADSALGAYAAANIRTTQNFAELVTGDLSDYFASGNKFEINATATITYPTAAIPTQFPGQGDLPPSDTDGVTVSAASNIAFQQYATTYSKNTIGMDETPAKIYHSEKPPEVAELHLNPVGDKVGDFTPLGINALNNGDKDWEDFDLLAVLDVTQIADRISEYADARVTIQLTQKQPNGVYGSPLDISEYLTCEFEGQAAMTDNGLSYTTTITRANLDDNGAEITFPMLHCEAKTGDALEADNLKYANYTITVTVILRNGNGVGYLFSQAQNYVVYTNAKIIPEYVNP
ncbi:MAG: hypothetical protein J6Z79_02420, partial [Clostridia bacterium]|nr:hypothetical protein [Clostridia bacterium]